MSGTIRFNMVVKKNTVFFMFLRNLNLNHRNETWNSLCPDNIESGINYARTPLDK